jgi:hypothetical protein
LSLASPLVLSLDGAEGPGDYALARGAALTLVVANDGKVVSSLGMTDVGAKDLPRVRALVESVTGTLPDDPAKLREALLAKLPDDPAALKERIVQLTLELRRAKQRGAEPRMREAPRRDAERPAAERDAKPLAGAVPEDPGLRELMRSLIQPQNTASDLDALFAELAERVGTDAELRRQAVEMGRRILATTYGTDDARARVKTWLEANAREER